MVIQNSYFVGRSKIRRMIELIVLLIITSVLFFWPRLMYDFRISCEIEMWQRLLIFFVIIAVYVLHVIRQLQRNLYFVYASDDDNENLIFRFYQIKLLGKKYNTYKIPFLLFYSFEIKKTNGNTELILFQKIDGKVAKYPPIYLNAFKQEEVEEMKSFLQSYSQK